jgi:hypothetical protein
MSTIAIRGWNRLVGGRGRKRPGRFVIATALSLLALLVWSGVALAGSPPVNTVPPTISGTAQGGSVLTAGHGTWTGSPAPSFTYQWQDCNTSGGSCSNITGATSSSYTLKSSDVGDTIVVVVTGTNSSGHAAASSSATGVVQALPPSNTAVPHISGTVKDTHVLTATTGTWAGSTPLTYTYQWQDCNTSGGSCSNITGATGSTYTLASSDVGDTIVVQVTASNTALPGGGTASASSAATTVVQAAVPANTAVPSISGPLYAASVLTATTGTWSGSTPLTYSYLWKRCNSSGGSCTTITGATGSTYTQTSSDVGHTLKVQVTASNASLPGGGTANATSAATGLVQATPAPPSNTSLPTISGTVAVGNTLTAGNGSWSSTAPITYSYQWEDCDAAGGMCTNITGATGGTYLLTSGDVGATVTVVVTATNVGGASNASASQTTLVEPTAGPTCTDVWVPAGTGAWETGSNWSTGTAPATSDVACLRAGSTPTLTTGGSVGVIQGPGATITITSGTLNVTSTTNGSQIGNLDQNGGTLKVQDQLTVDDALAWTAGTITGAGTINLASTSTSTITPASSSAIPELDGTTLNNAGTLTVDCSNPTGTWVSPTSSARTARCSTTPEP